MLVRRKPEPKVVDGFAILGWFQTLKNSARKRRHLELIHMPARVDMPMTRATDNNQIFFGIISQSAPRNQIMDFHLSSPATMVAVPAITPQDPLK